MNVSIENRCIWLSPEETGGNILEEIFKNYDFYSCEEKNNFELRNLTENTHSNGNVIPEEYQDFEVIVTIRNPYDRVWSCYLNFFTKNFIPKDFEGTKLKFNQFISNSFYKTLRGVITDPFYTGNDYFNKWKFDTNLPDSVIRFESIREDLESLDFIQKNPQFYDKSIFDDSRFKNEKFINFDEIYTFESAQIIFNFYKNYFYSLNYDPFSFTNQTLSEEEKKKFVHTYL